jgi:hypothetical protein
VRELAGGLAGVVDLLSGVAVAPSAEASAVELWFLLGGCFAEPVRFDLSETAGSGQSMDQRLRELAGGIRGGGAPNLEHLAVLLRWHGASWRDGEWIGFDSLEKIPYRKVVNAIGRVARR